LDSLRAVHSNFKPRYAGLLRNPSTRDLNTLATFTLGVLAEVADWVFLLFLPSLKTLADTLLIEKFTTVTR